MTSSPNLPPGLWDDNAPLPTWLAAGIKLSANRQPTAYPVSLSADEESSAMVEWAARPPVEKMRWRDRLIYETLVTCSPDLLG